MVALELSLQPSPEDQAVFVLKKKLDILPVALSRRHRDLSDRQITGANYQDRQYPDA